MEADPDVLVMGGPMVQGAPMPRELSTAWPAQLCCSASLPASRCGRPESHPWPHALVIDARIYSHVNTSCDLIKEQHVFQYSIENTSKSCIL